jgi:hypothetical protein
VAKPAATIMGGWRCWRSGAADDAKIVMTLPPEAFTPAPKVHSAVVHLTALPETPRFPVIRRLAAVDCHGFNQRRKMLRASLKGLRRGSRACWKAWASPRPRGPRRSGWSSSARWRGRWPRPSRAGSAGHKVGPRSPVRTRALTQHPARKSLTRHSLPSRRPGGARSPGRWILPTVWPKPPEDSQPTRSPFR